MSVNLCCAKDNTELGTLGVIPQSITFPLLVIWKNCGLGGMYALLAGVAKFSRAELFCTFRRILGTI